MLLDEMRGDALDGFLLSLGFLREFVSVDASLGLYSFFISFPLILSESMFF